MCRGAFPCVFVNVLPLLVFARSSLAAPFCGTVVGRVQSDTLWVFSTGVAMRMAAPSRYIACAPVMYYRQAPGRCMCETMSCC